MARKNVGHSLTLEPFPMYFSVKITFVCDGLRAFICSNETLPWEAVDGFSKERSSLRYFRILIQNQKVFIIFVF